MVKVVLHLPLSPCKNVLIVVAVIQFVLIKVVDDTNSVTMNIESL